jgi:hypothetical protein
LHVSHYVQIRDARQLREHVTNLVDAWGHYVINRRLTLFDVRLIFDAPYGHPGCRLHSRASYDFAATLYLHKQHTVGDTHVHT